MWRSSVFLPAILGIVMAGLLGAFALRGQAAAGAGLSHIAVCVAPPANMAAWYGLDETSGTAMNDITGAHTGTYYNNPAINSGQFVLNSRLFDGISQYGEAPTGPDFGAGDFTIDAWINLTSTGPQVLVDKRDVTPVGYMLFVSDGQLGMQIGDASGFTNYTMNSSTLNDGQWHFVAADVQRTGVYIITLWADSTIQAFTDHPRPGSLDNSSGLRLARNWPNSIEPPNYYNGSLDEVELFNRALAESELSAIRMAGTAGKCKPPANTPTPTGTPTSTGTPTPTPANSSTSTPTITPTPTRTATSARTATPTLAATASPTHTNTNTPAPTRTAFPPSAATKTATSTATGTPPTPRPTPANCTTYGIAVETGTILPATTLVPGSNCDDCVVDVDISNLGFYFPFYDLFNVPKSAFDPGGSSEAPAGPPIMRKMRMGANGTVELTNAATPTSTPTALSGTLKGAKPGPDAGGINSCLPAPATSYTIFPHWDDLRTDCPGCGIFTNITGAAGSRIFDIEWRAEYYLCGGRVDVELRLHETTGEFDVIYGQVDQAGSLTTVGVQRDPGLFTQYACNTPGSLTPGLMLVFTRQSCGAATPTSTASAGGTPPAATPTRTPVVVCLQPITVTPTATATATSCPIQFSDVPVGSTFYENVRCLACRGIVNGYADGTFRPGNNVTRGQLSKIVSNAAGFSDNQTTQMFQDVPTGSTFFQYIGRLASRGYISGYPCGGPPQPCVPPANLPYFRPNNSSTRGQISKIVSNAAGFQDPPGAQLFQDVAPGSAFYNYVQRLASRGYVGGYACGGPGEPCVPPANRPYFRPGNNATRGQTSKIVGNTFFPNCSTPARAGR